MRRIGFHTDIKKMYNSLKLVEGDWCYQMYLWQKDLNINQEPEEKVNKTVFVLSSEIQSKCGIRRTAQKQKDKFPRAHEIVCNDLYVDDGLSGENTLKKLIKVQMN